MELVTAMVVGTAETVDGKESSTTAQEIVGEVSEYKLFNRSNFKSTNLLTPFFQVVGVWWDGVG